MEMLWLGKVFAVLIEGLNAVKRSEWHICFPGVVFNETV